MTASTPGTYEIDVQDIEYLRHGDKALLARLFKPRGAGPFPLMVELHGGAWCRGDRLGDTAINEPLAKSGVVVAALDFRMPPDAAYPGSFADINYAIRWLKTKAVELGSRPDMVGSMGNSSGAHQAMLGGMRPRDPRYAALPLPAGSPAVVVRHRSARAVPLRQEAEGGRPTVPGDRRSRAALPRSVLADRERHGRG